MHTRHKSQISKNPKRQKTNKQSHKIAPLKSRIPPQNFFPKNEDSITEETQMHIVKFPNNEEMQVFMQSLQDFANKHQVEHYKMTLTIASALAYILVVTENPEFALIAIQNVSRIVDENLKGFEEAMDKYIQKIMLDSMQENKGQSIN